MESYYKILGVSRAATTEELRRAYRILARRYHPDVNPGRTSEEKFRRIAEAYDVLSDPIKRQQYDETLERGAAQQFFSTFDRAHEAYRRQQQRHQRRPMRDIPSQESRMSAQGNAAKQAESSRTSILRQIGSLPKNLRKKLDQLRVRAFTDEANRAKYQKGGNQEGVESRVSQVSLIEVSVSVEDAIKGVKKTVELVDGSNVRKISVTIPPGVRTGSVVRFRRREQPAEEVVLLVRVAPHPFLTMSQKGLVVQVPITVAEAIQGTRLQVPTLDDAVMMTVPAGTQSGTEIRLKDKGIKLRDGTRGDLFVKVMIQVPDAAEAVGLREKATELDQYYSSPVRQGLPSSILSG